MENGPNTSEFRREKIKEFERNYKFGDLFITGAQKCYTESLRESLENKKNDKSLSYNETESFKQAWDFCMQNFDPKENQFDNIVLLNFRYHMPRIDGKSTDVERQQTCDGSMSYARKQLEEFFSTSYQYMINDLKDSQYKLIKDIIKKGESHLRKCNCEPCCSEIDSLKKFVKAVEKNRLEKYLVIKENVARHISKIEDVVSILRTLLELKEKERIEEFISKCEREENHVLSNTIDIFRFSISFYKLSPQDVVSELIVQLEFQVAQIQTLLSELNTDDGFFEIPTRKCWDKEKYAKMLMGKTKNLFNNTNNIKKTLVGYYYKNINHDPVDSPPERLKCPCSEFMSVEDRDATQMSSLPGTKISENLQKEDYGNNKAHCIHRRFLNRDLIDEKTMEYYHHVQTCKLCSLTRTNMLKMHTCSINERRARSRVEKEEQNLDQIEFCSNPIYQNPISIYNQDCDTELKPSKTKHLTDQYLTPDGAPFYSLIPYTEICSSVNLRHTCTPDEMTQKKTKRTTNHCECPSIRVNPLNNTPGKNKDCIDPVYLPNEFARLLSINFDNISDKCCIIPFYVPKNCSLQFIMSAYWNIFQKLHPEKSHMLSFHNVNALIRHKKKSMSDVWISLSKVLWDESINDFIQCSQNFTYSTNEAILNRNLSIHRDTSCDYNNLGFSIKHGLVLDMELKDGRISTGPECHSSFTVNKCYLEVIKQLELRRPKTKNNNNDLDCAYFTVTSNQHPTVENLRKVRAMKKNKLWKETRQRVFSDPYPIMKIYENAPNLLDEFESHRVMHHIAYNPANKNCQFNVACESLISVLYDLMKSYLLNSKDPYIVIGRIMDMVFTVLVSKYQRLGQGIPPLVFYRDRLLYRMSIETMVMEAAVWFRCYHIFETTNSLLKMDSNKITHKKQDKINNNKKNRNKKNNNNKKNRNKKNNNKKNKKDAKLNVAEIDNQIIESENKKNAKLNVAGIDNQIIESENKNEETLSKNQEEQEEPEYETSIEFTKEKEQGNKEKNTQQVPMAKQQFPVTNKEKVWQRKITTTVSNEERDCLQDETFEYGTFSNGFCPGFFRYIDDGNPGWHIGNQKWNPFFYSVPQFALLPGKTRLDAY